MDKELLSAMWESHRAYMDHRCWRCNIGFTCKESRRLYAEAHRTLSAVDRALMVPKGGEGS